MIITNKQWDKYIKLLRRINDQAAKEMSAIVPQLRAKYQAGELTEDGFYNAIIDYGYGLATKYGEASAAVSCEMYDAMAVLSGGKAPPAVPAATATYNETAGAVRGAMAFSKDDEVVAAAVGRLVKMASADTVMKNAIRDFAEWAWIPRGDTCAFCLALASRGWQKAGMYELSGSHVEHIHPNCDCTFAIRFSPQTQVEGYDPDAYLRMYQGASTGGSREKINALRRDFYARNRERINEQKRSAYAKRRELESSAAEEINVD